mmetsp:Transcript_4076/g.11588  ORF Transcript_4076/g.11588 Transcript_4076/m.11588 type:complete len:545 (+) Transcript_4076:36-1670(+)
MRAQAVALLALGVQLGAGWVTLPQDETDRKISWVVPEDPLDDSGLGGGIAFAIDPAFCERLLPVFKEDSGPQIKAFQFITCEEINDAIARAMTTWSLNHPYVKFYNVTDECIDENDGARCSVAELYIDAKPPAPGNEAVAAFVLHNPTNIGREYGSTVWRTGVRQPSGDTISNDWIIEFATLTFHNHICWYLDASFCDKFRILNENVDATLLMQFIIWGVWALSFLILFLRAAQVFFFIFRFGVKVGFRKTIKEQTRTMLLTYVLLFCMISPPIIWFQIFTPCLTCYDFEGTAAHEIGHVLGFTHTDTFPEVHRVAIEDYKAENCDPSLHVPGNNGAVVRFDPNDPTINDSIMFHLTTKKSKTCLSPNDLQGLLYQYPVCDEELIHTGESICVKTQRNMGWVRFLTATVPPFLISSVIVFALVKVALYYENKEQTKNRWKLGGISAVQEGRRRRYKIKANKEEKEFAKGIVGRAVSKGVSKMSQSFSTKKKPKAGEGGSASNSVTEAMARARQSSARSGAPNSARDSAPQGQPGGNNRLSIPEA